MTDLELKDLESKIDIVSKLLAHMVIAGKTSNDQIDLLSSVGFKAQDIACILKKSDNQVYVTLNQIKKKKKQKKSDA